MSKTQSDSIVEGNKLIAEFMGYYLRNDSPYYHSGNKKTEIEHRGMHHEHLDYHTSWDWLMPVVEKIEKYNFVGAVVISRDHCWISDDKEPADNDNIVGAHLSRKNKLDATWNAVVQFITWYNQHK